jgi:ParB-like chromosome segregation protein Spo0J
VSDLPARREDVLIDHLRPGSSEDDLRRQLAEAHEVIARMHAERREAVRRVIKMTKRGAGLVRLLTESRRVLERAAMAPGFEGHRQQVLSMLDEGKRMAREPGSPWRDVSSDARLLAVIRDAGLDPDLPPEEARVLTMLFGDPRTVAALDAAADFDG